MVDEHPNYFKGFKKPYPILIRSYLSKTMYDDVPITVKEFNQHMKHIPDNLYPFETPTSKLVAQLDRLSPSKQKQYSAAYFEEMKENLHKFFASV